MLINENCSHFSPNIAIVCRGNWKIEEIELTKRKKNERERERERGMVVGSQWGRKIKGIGCGFGPNGRQTHQDDDRRQAPPCHHSVKKRRPNVTHSSSSSPPPSTQSSPPPPPLSFPHCSVLY